jgi:hypoxanthine phosphoribosyltransferase
MKRIKLWDKEFELSLTFEEIQLAIRNMACKMKIDLEGKETLFICILNGAFMFASDLMKELELTDAEITFLKMASYTGINSNGTVKELIGLNEVLTGRTVVILEDIVDTGLTMAGVIEQIKDKGAREVKVASLLFKPGSLKTDFIINYTGIIIENDFVVGYGLDYDGRGRNLKDIYTLIK